MRDDIKRKLDPNKSPGRDRISIRMLKMSSDAIIKPLRNFQKLLKMWTIPDGWIKGNIVPTFKKASNKTSNTIVQLLYFQCATRFLMNHDNMFKYFLGNNLVSPKQSRFRSAESCINQFL